MFSVSRFRQLSQAQKNGEITIVSDEYKAMEDAIAHRLSAQRKSMTHHVSTT